MLILEINIQNKKALDNTLIYPLRLSSINGYQQQAQPHNQLPFFPFILTFVFRSTVSYLLNFHEYCFRHKKIVGTLKTNHKILDKYDKYYEYSLIKEFSRDFYNYLLLPIQVN